MFLTKIKITVLWRRYTDLDDVILDYNYRIQHACAILQLEP